MKRSKFTEAQIAFILRQAEEGARVEEVCRKAGISQATFYNWKKKYGGLMPSEMKRLKQLEEESGRLKRIVAGLSLDKEMLQDLIRGLRAGESWWIICVQPGGSAFGAPARFSGPIVRPTSTSPNAGPRTSFASASARSLRRGFVMATGVSTSCSSARAGR